MIEVSISRVWCYGDEKIFTLSWADVIPYPLRRYITPSLKIEATYCIRIPLNSSSSYEECICKGISYLWNVTCDVAKGNKGTIYKGMMWLKANMYVNKMYLKTNKVTTYDNFPLKWCGWWWMIRIDGSGRDCDGRREDIPLAYSPSFHFF